MDYAQTRRVVTEDQGRFTFTDLAGGEYVFDTSRIRGRAKNPETKVTIADGEKQAGRHGRNRASDIRIGSRWHGHRPGR